MRALPSQLAAGPRSDGRVACEKKRENSRLLSEDIAARRVVYRGLPEVVTLNSTDICNLRCVMCQRSERQGRYRLEDRVLEFVCEQLFPTAWKANLTTSGGEPLGAGFELILEHALRHATRVDVMTNGMRLDRVLSRRLLPALDHLNVSVDCAVPEVYERIRVGGDHRRLVRNLQAFADERQASGSDALFSLSAVVMASTLPHLADLVRFAARVGADGVVLQRLQHWAKRTPEEDPAAHFAPAEIAAFLDAADAAGCELGVNVFAGELGRPPVVVRPLRPKVPEERGGGTCSFLAQTFTVLYTGEVYPCGQPTDYKLGNVLYEDPARIWNGVPLQRLRAAHLSRRGTLFCNGCDHAPHLPATAPTRAREWARLGRRVVSHVANGVERKLRAQLQPRIYAPRPPRFATTRFVRRPEVGVCRVRDLGGERQAVAVDPTTGALGFVTDDALFLEPEPGVEPRELAAWREEGFAGAYASCLAFLPSGDALLSLEGSGLVLRVERTTGRVERALQLSDPRSFVRTSGVACTASGLLVGEYGVFPGARVARLYNSRDDGRSFSLVHAYDGAHHVHRVLATNGGADVLVTTGDLPTESRTYLGDASSGRMRCLLDAWAGFTAIAHTRDYFHFGSDFAQGNVLVRWRRDLSGPPEGRALPPSLDLQWRQLETLPDGRLVALGAIDENLTERRAATRATLLLSGDEGATWSVLHRFDDWDDAPESFAVLPGRSVRLVTGTVRASQLIELPPHEAAAPAAGRPTR